MTCITTAQNSIVLNGSSLGFFKGGRGIRQGDPVSPYIFVLVMEVLSRMLNKASSVPGFSFHYRCRKINLNRLLFADDLMLFARAYVFSTLCLKNQLDLFSKASGLKVNEEKSHIFFAGISDEL